MREQNTTPGHYATESEACAHFDSLLERDYRWLPDRATEVRGRIEYAMEGEPESRTVRIDRILFPSPVLTLAGWDAGPIGVEIKRSDKKLGPALSQCFDYRRSIFDIDGKSTRLGWVFLFPCPQLYGAIASICVQHRIGACNLSWDKSNLVFYNGAQLMLTRRAQHVLPRSGLKMGSR